MNSETAAPLVRSGDATTQRTGSQGGGAVFNSADLIDSGNDYTARRTIVVKDMGNPLVIEARDNALGRAYEFEDQASTARIMRRDRELTAIDAMEKFGGAFVRALGHAARCADQQNYETLRNAFPVLWKKYAEEHERREVRKYD